MSPPSPLETKAPRTLQTCVCGWVRQGMKQPDSSVSASTRRCVAKIHVRAVDGASESMCRYRSG